MIRWIVRALFVVLLSGCQPKYGMNAEDCPMYEGQNVALRHISWEYQPHMWVVRTSSVNVEVEYFDRTDRYRRMTFPRQRLYCTE